MEKDKKELKKEAKKKRKEELKNKPSKKLIFKRIFLLVLIVLWALLVFGLSNQDGDESSGLSHLVTTWIFKTEELVDKYEPIMRKIAHFSEYAVGGVLIFTLIDTYDYKTKNKIFITFFIGLWYAILDEIHQTFIPYRSGNPIDVCIDMLGFILGIVFINLVIKIDKKIMRRKEVEPK